MPETLKVKSKQGQRWEPGEEKSEEKSLGVLVVEDSKYVPQYHMTLTFVFMGNTRLQPHSSSSSFHTLPPQLSPFPPLLIPPSGSLHLSISVPPFLPLHHSPFISHLPSLSFLLSLSTILLPSHTLIVLTKEDSRSCSIRIITHCFLSLKKFSTPPTQSLSLSVCLSFTLKTNSSYFRSQIEVTSPGRLSLKPLNEICTSFYS